MTGRSDEGQLILTVAEHKHGFDFGDSSFKYYSLFGVLEEILTEYMIVEGFEMNK